MDQKIQLFCLPFAGGSSYSYREFARHYNGFIKMVPIDLPGHGKKLGKSLLTDIHEITDDVFHHIQENLCGPYAIYGHSMGALIGYLLSLKIVQEKLSPPIHLFLSGHQGPPIAGKEKGLHRLLKKKFLCRIIEYGGVPREVAMEEDLMDLFEPILRADFQAIAEYQYEKTERLDIPITVMFGEHETFSYADALTWQEVTKRPIQVKRFPGNHFFIFEYIPAITDIVSQTLLKTVGES